MAELFVESLIRRHKNVVSDLDLHCLPIILSGVSRLKWVALSYCETIVWQNGYTSKGSNFDKGVIAFRLIDNYSIRKE